MGQYRPVRRGRELNPLDALGGLLTAGQLRRDAGQETGAN